ncbi:hypothetical protein GCM10010293_29720 [Streptomyces griseoflavus]|uniref:hypothetical protein n=1 Tax=Streptomyces griseoflavus TaxID=35619 RepID=UPI00167DA179|nr:hypothetical protein [Streptomyces griseoflavus]GGV29798.1 hypothetical protein GCM10010293_29720 [Streptomyces griseoflavus]
MDQQDGAEPVFVRSRWGTNRYVYNPASPVGRALIVGSLLFGGIALWLLHDDASWSEGELRDAVHAAVAELDGGPVEVGGWRGDYAQVITEAVRNSGEGPEHGSLRVSDHRERGDGGGAPTADRFEVGSDDVEDVYCLSVSPPWPGTFTVVSVDLTVTVAAGRC